MWVMLTLWSFIGTIVFIAWRGNMWFAQRMAAHADTHNGERYNYHEERSKYGKLVNLLLTFDVPRDRYFRLRRESWFDRFGKGIHLAVEPETGEPVFDQTFFLDSDDEVLVALLVKERKLRSALIVLMGRIARQRARLISLNAENGKLTLYMRVFSATEPARLREECVAFLSTFLQAIRDLPSTPVRAPRGTPIGPDKARQIALIVFAIGCGSASWIAFLSPDRFSEPWGFIRFSAMVGAVVFGALTWWALRHLGRASNRHRAMVLWTFFTLVGAVCFSFTALRAINIYLDFSEHESIAVEKAVLGVHYRRKVGTSYRITYQLDAFRKNQFGDATIDWFEYRRLQKVWAGADAGPAIVSIHPGFFGFQWKEIDPLPITVAD